MRNTDLTGNLARSLHRDADLTWNRNTYLTRYRDTNLTGYRDAYLAGNLARGLNRDLVALSLHGFLAVRSGRSNMSSTMGISWFSISLTLTFVVSSMAKSNSITDSPIPSSISNSSNSHSVSNNIGGGMDSGVGLCAVLCYNILTFFNCGCINDSISLGVTSLISLGVTSCGGINDCIKLSVTSLLCVTLGEIMHSAVFIGDLNSYLMALLLWSKI